MTSRRLTLWLFHSATPLTRAAIFLVVTINPDPDNRAAVRSFCADLPALIRAVEFRDLEAGLSCVMGIGSDAWDRLFGDPRPAELHPFREIRAGPRHAVSTPGDLMFHIRAKRMDLCFEVATQIMATCGLQPQPSSSRGGGLGVTQFARRSRRPLARMRRRTGAGGAGQVCRLIPLFQNAFRAQGKIYAAPIAGWDSLRSAREVRREQRRDSLR